MPYGLSSESEELLEEVRQEIEAIKQMLEQTKDSTGRRLVPVTKPLPAGTRTN